MSDPAADLEALGIDSAPIRILAARDYIDEQGAAVTRQIKALFLVTEFLDLAERNAIRRGADYRPGWGIKLTAADYLTARATIIAPYTGAVRERALEILDDYVPPELRAPQKHRVRG